jgi:hypothetical protein
LSKGSDDNENKNIFAQIKIEEEKIFVWENLKFFL